MGRGVVCGKHYKGVMLRSVNAEGCGRTSFAWHWDLGLILTCRRHDNEIYEHSTSSVNFNR